MLRGTLYIVIDGEQRGREIATVREAQTVEDFHRAAGLLFGPRGGSLEFGPIGPPWSTLPQVRGCTVDRCQADA